MNSIKRLPRRFFVLALAVGLAAVLVAGVVFAGTVSVDHFDGPATTATVDNSTPYAFTYTNYSGILGNYRSISLTHIVGTQASSVSSNYGGSSFLSFNNGSDATNRVTIQWDGDSNATLNPVGLGGVDLVSGTNTAIGVRVLDDDFPVTATLRFWTDASHCSQRTFLTTGSVNKPVDYVIPMSTFTVTCPSATSTGTFTNVGAIELFMDASIVQATDISLEFIDAEGDAYDYGDLPLTGPIQYTGIVTNTTPTNTAGRHKLGNGLRLGQGVDAELDGQPSILANGDDINDTDDEEGVIKTPGFTWTPDASDEATTGGAVNVTVKGRDGACVASPTSGRCFVEGWIDWNKDGNFNSPNEHIIKGTIAAGSANGGRITSVNGSAQTLFFDIPITANLTSAAYYARFRLCGGVDSPTDDCNTPGGTSAIGEVEDYLISFGGTDVNLASFSAAKTGDHNTLTWETASELHNLGFNIWRGTDASNPTEKLNAAVIPSQAPGGTGGFTYTYDDLSAPSGTTYYWLEDVDLNGTVTRHGPVTVAATSAPSAVRLSSLTATAPAAATWPLLGTGLLALVGAGVIIVRRRR